MGIFYGDTEANNFWLGANQVESVYVGDELVWSNIVSMFIQHLSNSKTYALTNTVSRINPDGTMLANVLNVGTARVKASGAAIGSVMVTYGGSDGAYYFPTLYNVVTRTGQAGTLLGSETAIDAYYPSELAVGLDGIGLYTYRSDLLRLDSMGTKLSFSAVLPTNYGRSAGASLKSASMALYFGYVNTLSGYGRETNKVTRRNNSGAIIGAETTAGTIREYAGGASANDNTQDFAIIWGGSNEIDYNNISRYRTLTKINSNGAQVGSEVNHNTVNGITSTAYRFVIPGGPCGLNAMFVGGTSPNEDETGIHRYNSSLASVGYTVFLNIEDAANFASDGWI